MIELDPLRLIVAGGWVVPVILVVSVAAWVLLAAKWMGLNAEARASRQLARHVLAELGAGRHGNAEERARCSESMTGRVLAAALRFETPDRRMLDRRLRPIIEGEAADLRRHLPLVAVLCSILPLLGLLGTVLGMLETFSALASAGGVRVGSVASGVSRALITTQLGLLAAVPILFVQNWLVARTESCIQGATLCFKKAAGVICREEGASCSAP